MNLKYYLSIFSLILFSSCGSNTNSEEFIQKTTGRYLYNSDEIIEAYYNDNQLFVKWRGATKIQPLKVNDNTFFVKEMNEKIQFLDNPTNGKTYLVLVPKEEKDSIEYNFKKLKENEKIPSEYLNEKSFDKALKAYLLIKQKDSLDPTLNENNFNRLGYNKLKDKNFDEALNIFKINIELHPESANVYDSYAEALSKSGDTIQAVEYYKKSISIDSGNRKAKQYIKKYDKK